MGGHEAVGFYPSAIARPEHPEAPGHESQHGRWNDFPWDPCATQMPEKEAIAKIVSTVIGSLLSRFR